jgi:NitT/TauT family transport system permease protein
MNKLLESRFLKSMLPALTIIMLFVAWQLATTALHVPSLYLPSPFSIIQAMISQPIYFMQEGVYTLETTLIGFVLAAVLGVLIALLIVEVRLLDSTLYTLIVALNSVPKVAIAPLFVIWLGSGQGPKVAISFLIAFFPIVIDTVLGLKSVSQDMLDLAKSMRSPRADLFWRIRIPSALPSIFAGMKVSISLALVGAIVGEFVASDRGLGYVILSAQGSFDTPQIFAANIMLGVIGIVLFSIIAFLERFLLPWHASQRH